MYDKLVKDLRENHDKYFARDMEAADAIEKLQRFVETNKTSHWIPVEDHLPEEFVSVQAHMTDAGPFPSVREGYLAGGRWFFPALDEFHPVDRWRAFDEPPKEAPHAES